MKNNVKRIIATTAAAALTASIATMAGATDANNIYINGALIENQEIKVVENKKFIPLRAICEQLDFTVEWDNETRTIAISSMPLYITCSPDRDGYTFARTAPMLLGDAPKLIEDRTYVPINFVEEILKGELEETEDGISILYGEIAQYGTVSGTICDMVYEDEKLVQIVIGDKDDVMSQTVLNLSEELAAKALELGLEIGSEITAKITETMTMSIPPQVIPTEFVTNDTDVEAEVETVEVSGTVCELIYDENEKLVQIAVGEKEDVMSQTIFNLSDELSEKAIELDIKEGTQIKGIAAAMQTMSIPPQQPLFTLEIAE